MIRVLPVYFDESVDLTAFEPESAVIITKPDGTNPVEGGIVLTDSFRVASLPHEHPVVGIAGSPRPPVG